MGGALLVAEALSGSWDAGSNQSRLPVLCLGHDTVGTPVHRVADDALHNATKAVEKIWIKGYRRIGLIIESGSPWSPPYAAGFAQGMAAAKVFGAGRRLHRPDGLLVATPALLVCLTARWLDAGDFGVALLDVLENEPSDFTGIFQNTTEVACGAVQSLLAIIGDPGDRAVQHILVEGTWTDGASLPPRG